MTELSGATIDVLNGTEPAGTAAIQRQFSTTTTPMGRTSATEATPAMFERGVAPSD